MITAEEWAKGVEIKKRTGAVMHKVEEFLRTHHNEAFSNKDLVEQLKAPLPSISYAVIQLHIKGKIERKKIRGTIYNKWKVYPW